MPESTANLPFQSQSRVFSDVPLADIHWLAQSAPVTGAPFRALPPCSTDAAQFNPAPDTSPTRMRQINSPSGVRAGGLYRDRQLGLTDFHRVNHVSFKPLNLTDLNGLSYSSAPKLLAYSPPRPLSDGRGDSFGFGVLFADHSLASLSLGFGLVSPDSQSGRAFA